MKKTIGRFLAMVCALISILGTNVIAQQTQFNSVEVRDDVTYINHVRPGFTLWGFWDEYSREPACLWGEFRQLAETLNPTFARANFTEIPVGATVRIPTRCVSIYENQLPLATQVVSDTSTSSSSQLFAAPIVPQQVVLDIGPNMQTLLSQLVTASVQQGVGSFTYTGSVQTQSNLTQSLWSTILAWSYWVYVAITFLVLSVLFLAFWLSERSARKKDLLLAKSKDFQIGELKKENRLIVDKVKWQDDLIDEIKAENDLLKEENRKLTSQRNSANSRYGSTLRKLKQCEKGLEEQAGHTEEAGSAEKPSRKPRGGRRQRRSIKSQKNREEDLNSTE